jgi:hypothetical protein
MRVGEVSVFPLLDGVMPNHEDAVSRSDGHGRLTTPAVPHRRTAV